MVIIALTTKFALDFDHRHRSKTHCCKTLGKSYRGLVGQFDENGFGERVLVLSFCGKHRSCAKALFSHLLMPHSMT